MKTRVITSAVGLVVLFAVMALFDTFVFNVVIAAICLLAIHEVFKAFRFEKAAYIYWGFVPYTLLVMFSDFHMVRICMLPASYIFALYLVCVSSAIQSPSIMQSWAAWCCFPASSCSAFIPSFISSSFCRERHTATMRCILFS